MLKIRLQRTGRKHEPTFRIVLTDSKNSTKSGKFKEILGSYDPRFDKQEIKTDRVLHWIKEGVQVSDSIHNLFINTGTIKGAKKNVLSKKSPIVDEAKIKAEAEAAAKAAEEKARAEAEAAAKEAEAVEAAAAPAEETPAEPVVEAEAPKEEVAPEAPAEETKTENA